MSTTADIWSINNKSFMGVTMHWMGADTLKREKAAITCKRFRGQHVQCSSNRIRDLFSLYGLNNNEVTACVIDNGGNFMKAFKEYQ